MKGAQPRRRFDADRARHILDPHPSNCRYGHLLQLMLTWVRSIRLSKPKGKATKSCRR
jgi:hypothetical protein